MLSMLSTAWVAENPQVIGCIRGKMAKKFRMQKVNGLDNRARPDMWGEGT